MLEALLSVDEQWLIRVNELSGTAIADRLMLLASGRLGSIPVYVLAAYYLLKHLGLRSFGWVVLSVVSLVIVTDQGSVVLFKEMFQRLRPCHNPDLLGQINLVSGRCGGSYGFISSHASNVFGFATLISFLLRGRGIIWYSLFAWASIVAFSRIYLGVHYPFDVLAGSLYGLIIGSLMVIVTKKHLLP